MEAALQALPGSQMRADASGGAREAGTDARSASPGRSSERAAGVASCRNHRKGGRRGALHRGSRAVRGCSVPPPWFTRPKRPLRTHPIGRLSKDATVRERASHQRNLHHIFPPALPSKPAPPAATIPGSPIRTSGRGDQNQAGRSARRTAANKLAKSICRQHAPARRPAAGHPIGAAPRPALGKIGNPAIFSPGRLAARA